MRAIAYLGPENTNTHLAARRRFGADARYVHAPTVDEVFHLVEQGRADYGVVPVENSLEGAVTHTLDRFIDAPDTQVEIHGEVQLPIRHALVLRRGRTLSRIRAVYSHPQALAQCHRWLRTHLPRAEHRETNSTADAVQYVLADTAREPRAAVGRQELATRGLRAVPIPNARENRTRFLVLGLGAPWKGTHNKTSILFALRDKSGALHDALVPFKRHRINLTKIESRPSKRKAWEYLFFVDAMGHEADKGLSEAIGELQRVTTRLQVLGSYPVDTR